MEETEFKVKTAADSRVFAEFVAVLEGRRSEVNPHKRQNDNFLEQPRKADFSRCSRFFRLRGGSSTSKYSLEGAVPTSTFSHPTVRIGLLLISQGTVKEASNFFIAASG
jgi:hypothetical protein